MQEKCIYPEAINELFSKRKAITSLLALLVMCASSGSCADERLKASKDEVLHDGRISGNLRYGYWYSHPRPRDFYMLVKGINENTCKKALKSFNEAGKYSGDSLSQWLVDGDKLVSFRNAKDDSEISRSPPRYGASYSRIDVDGDGKEEIVYKATGVLASELQENILILDASLESEEEFMLVEKKKCDEFYRSEKTGRCSSAEGMITYAVNSSFSERPIGEWEATKTDFLYQASLSSPLLKEFREKRVRNPSVRIVTERYQVLWNLFESDAGLVVVSIPSIQTEKRPGLLVFKSDPLKNITLECVATPKYWFSSWPIESNMEK